VSQEVVLLTDLELLRESVDLECKLAAGSDGRGVVPEDFWPTYSAFANMHGGVVFLGVKEKQGQFFVTGIQDLVKVRKELFDALNNRQKVSVNLLTDEAVQEVLVEGKTVFKIEIPRARREQRPVHLTLNPFGHTFLRLNDGDRRLTDEAVKRMLAEQVDESLDVRLLPRYGLKDLDAETLRAYRQIFFNRDPTHPFNAVDNLEFLRLLGGWRADRETGESGLTLAGLLMFGEMTAIQEALPNYMLDYQERLEEGSQERWVDRLTLDGKWSGNLFDFHRKVYLKLTADLKVPFRLEHGERKDETPVHEALREALTNVLVHADYSDRASVLVVKQRDMFRFRNPGLMRIPIEAALRGGTSDCRNRTLHRMFRLAGVGEQAGTGIPKILQDWSSQHWSPPKLEDIADPNNQTVLELRMIGLFPAEVMADLRLRLGEQFDALTELERTAVALAASEGTVNHARLRTLTATHPVDISKMLQRLTQVGILESTRGRGAVYHLAGQAIVTPEEVFGPVFQEAHAAAGAPDLPENGRSLDLPENGGRSLDLPEKGSLDLPEKGSLDLPEKGVKCPDSRENGGKPLDLLEKARSLDLPENGGSLDLPENGRSLDLPENGGRSLDLPEITAAARPKHQRNADGCILHEKLALPLVDDLNELSASLRGRLETIAAEPRTKGKVPQQVMSDVLLKLCEDHLLTLRCLAALVSRKPESLRSQYLAPLVQDRKLVLAFPKTPNHELQAYRSSSGSTR